ncbi:DUF4189 domain-containing protein [Agrobacterium rhizogenes]|uniref:DUF4189 domain-containing protein n=1 Tax=Rhizobium rhizogenes TaxID=359 RepID=UPI0005680568|nr:DUF4189 domain-containing protein [Rhizobium rhizogenes]NTF83800.1 DUF4189 domain-containing protein [Rhizobium rhizogenes]NTH79851.1 DUF4189 domain-containing protein [Rhizobium rhizogenes]NTH85828.1 DUF4189 domain-containing protein [Rhizobium rhizogenes]
MLSGRPVIRNSVFAALVAICAILPPTAHAADPIVQEQYPEPPVTQDGIWGAIAFSPLHNKYGFFWGADKREEAENIAVKYCQNQADSGCRLAITFRNHRHWTDDDQSGFPYEHCAALSVAEDRDRKVTHWGAASAATRKDAEDAAIKSCGDSNQCKIHEWVCT